MNVTNADVAAPHSETIKAVEEICHAISHNAMPAIRNVICRSSILLREHNDLSPLAVRHVESMARSGQHLAAVIDALLRYERASSVAVHLEQVRLKDVLEPIVHQLRTCGKLAFELRWDEDVQLVGDPRLLRLMFGELVSNVLRWVPDAKGASVRCHHCKNGVEIHVIDEGPGIPDAYRHRVFEPFEQLEPTMDGNGVGIGLAIVRRLAERHGGWADAPTREEQKGTVRLFLPWMP